MTFETIFNPGLAQHYAEAGLWQNKTLADFLDEAATATPDKTASVDSRGSTTYGELKQQVDRCALGLLELGVGPGDVVSIQLPNWREWLVAHYAAVRIGAVTNPLIPVYRDREIGFMMGRAGARVAIVPATFRNYDYPAMIARLRPELPTLEHVLVVDAGPGPAQGFTSWEDFMATPWEERRDPAGLAALRPDPNSVSLLIFTSGTTGEPKGVMHTHNTLVAGSMPWPDKLGMDNSAVIHMASTFAHLTGYLYGVSLPLQLGATGVFQETWNAETFVELVERHRIGHTSGATPFLHDLLNAGNLNRHDVSSLKRFCCMGAPIPRVMVRQAHGELPGMSVFGGWGQTECGLVTMGHPADPLEKIFTSDGRPLAGMQIRIVDLDGVELPADTDGRLQIQGPFLFQGYLGRLEETRALLDGDWFDTGDLGSIDADGYLRIAGRTKDVIIRGGENIPVAYVENVLYEHPLVEEVAVVAIPHPRLQEMACAAVVLREGAGLTFSDLQQFLTDKGVAKPYWPERLEILGELPRTPSGKIQKFHLRDRFASPLPTTEGIR
ncbi:MULTISPECIES: AMP-binding protein [unclassified Arthrobacter]|uniref:AMP-binding protein n=1 Tax=unclassified Arthrobacter TaxID=235627 RepID=UPI00159EB187|nr:MULTISPECIES: AMP-binding protein [unclassified Arthrobacter]MCQ9165333.1 AMP-binding protein [Arthrobacter sp. STN4]NVN00130.1 AMP-binding protein [Arthrobacter sp. SDTb3-6]